MSIGKVLTKYVLVFVITTTILIIIGCNDNQVPYTSIVIDIDNIQNGKATVEIEKQVALENTLDSQFGEISRLEFYSNRYFIFDQFYSKSVFVFDSLGFFIKKTKVGRGPDECINPTEFVIDKENNCILVWDQAKVSFMKYTLDLNFIESTKYQGLYLRKAITLPNDNYLVYSQNPSRNSILTGDKNTTFYNYYIYDHSFDTCIRSILPTTPELAQIHLDSPISNNGRALFITPFDNNIYTIQDNIEKICFSLDFGSKNVSKNEFNLLGYKAIYEKAKLGEKVIFLDNVFESKDFLSFSVSYMKSRRYFFYSKNSLKVYDAANLFLDNEVQDFQIVSVTIRDHFLGIFKLTSPQDLRNAEIKERKTYLDEYYYVAHFVIREE